MILSDSEILAHIDSGALKITGDNKKEIQSQIGPASLDFRLGNIFKIYDKTKIKSLNPREGVKPENIKTIKIKDDESYEIKPGEFILGVTKEQIKVPYNMVARCEGRSSIGRLGIIIHSTAGFIDPGFEGTITLEIANINEIPVKLYPGMRIGQFAFETIYGAVKDPYDKRKGSKYMGQILPEESRINKDIENESGEIRSEK